MTLVMSQSIVYSMLQNRGFVLSFNIMYLKLPNYTFVLVLFKIKNIYENNLIVDLFTLRISVEAENFETFFSFQNTSDKKSSNVPTKVTNTLKCPLCKIFELKKNYEHFKVFSQLN